MARRRMINDENENSQPFYVPLSKRHLFRGVNAWGYLPPLIYPELSPVVDLEDRINNLEAISAEPGQIPRRYHDRLEQIQREVVYLRNKIIETRVKKQQVGKSSYRGLSIKPLEEMKGI